MKKYFIIICSFILFIINQSQPCYASCETGPILFRNIVYGSGIGAGIGALVLIANSTKDKIVPNIATAALIGSGFGVGIGILDITLSQCHGFGSHDDADNLEFHLKPSVFVKRTQLANEVNATTTIYSGLTLEYQLN